MMLQTLLIDIDCYQTKIQTLNLVDYKTNKIFHNRLLKSGKMPNSKTHSDLAHRCRRYFRCPASNKHREWVDDKEKMRTRELGG